MSSLLIQNGTLYDGTGREGYKGDLLIENGLIAQMGELRGVRAERVIDARGMAVCPGFVDIHRHCDRKPFCTGEFGVTELLQGITTTVVGNCGISHTPVSPSRAKETYDFNEPVLGPACQNAVYDFADYMKALDSAALPINFASMIGTGSVKISVKGFADTPYTREELSAARDLVEDALKNGAVGVSLGIMYLPECYSSTDEFAAILEPVGRFGRVITAHIRGEGDSLVQSVAEVIEIAKKAGCALEISHFKACGMKNWQKEIHKAIALIEKARANGQVVTCDFYPYEGGSTALTTMLPPVFVAGDMAAALQKLGTPAGVEELRRACGVVYPRWDNFAITLGWERILISGVVNERNRKFLGKSVSAAAGEYGFADAVALAAHLMHDEGGRTAIINMSMCQEDIDTIARLPYSTVISDAIYADTDTPHPRMFGAFPKIIREYVNERHVYTLGEAIHRMTGMPAARMKLSSRGELRLGYAGDVLVFDPLVFRDNATFAQPARQASGLAFSIIGGKIAVENGTCVARSCGRNLRAE